MTQVKAVCFDCFGTTHPYPAKRDRAEEVREQMFRLGYILSRDQIARAIDNITPRIGQRCAYDSQFAQQKKFHSQAYYLEWYRLLLVELGERVEIADEECGSFPLQLFEEYYFDDGFQLHEQVIPMLDFLKRKEIKVALITNATSRVRELLARDHILSLFDLIIISGEVGFEKPNAGIFEITLAKMKVRPANAIYVGDSRDTDYDGAQKVGMRPILIDWHRRLANTEGLTVIPDLFALQHFV